MPASGSGTNSCFIFSTSSTGSSRAARLLNTPGIFWEPLLRAAVFAEMGWKDDAQRQALELIRLQPDFAANGRTTMARLLSSETMVTKLWGSLAKTGVSQFSGSTEGSEA